jgi:hypothetical protein
MQKLDENKEYLSLPIKSVTSMELRLVKNYILDEERQTIIMEVRSNQWLVDLILSATMEKARGMEAAKKVLQ